MRRGDLTVVFVFLLGLGLMWEGRPGVANAQEAVPGELVDGGVFEAPPLEVVVTAAPSPGTAGPGTADPTGVTMLQKTEDWISDVFRAYREGRWADGAGLIFSAFIGLMVMSSRLRALVRWDRLPKQWRPWLIVGAAAALTMASGFAAHADVETIARNTWRAGSSAIAAWELILKHVLGGKDAPPAVTPTPAPLTA